MSTSGENDWKDMITLDSGSTMSILANRDLVKNVGKVKDPILLQTNADTRICDEKAIVPGFGDVWFNKNAIANIFGLSDLKKKYRVTYGSRKEDAFIVYMNGSKVRFSLTKDGLYQNRSYTQFDLFNNSALK